MFFKLVLATLTAITAVQAETVYLVVKSDDAAVDGNTLGFLHEGAGINYAFLGNSSESAPLVYDQSEGTLLYEEAGLPQSFGVQGGYAQVSVMGADAEYAFNSDGELTVNGTANNFYACMNTNDPYDYSSMSYELMYYASDAPSGCIELTLETETPSSSSSSSSSAAGSASSSAAGSASSTLSTSSTSAASTASSSSVSAFEGAAARYVPAGAFAALAGAAAALI